jgi:hypothetical protein
MKSKKITALALAAVLSLGTVSVAVADNGPGKGGEVKVSLSVILSGLVTKGVITQAQDDAITAAIEAARPPKPELATGSEMEAMEGARHAVVLKVLGIDEATFKADRKAGKTLAQIDPTKTAALILALVAFETTQIDAAVTAGKITAVQATMMKANLTLRVTAAVNTVKGPGHGPDGDKNGKHGKHGGNGGLVTTGSTATNG